MAALRPQGHHQLSAPRTVHVGAGRLLRWVDGFADRHGSYTVSAAPDVLTLRADDGSSTAAIQVPFPPLVGTRLADLLAHVATARRVGVLLVRRSGYAVGLFVGASLESSKVGSSYVQGTTKAGGWSQQRYARRRDNQAAAAFASAADVAVRILGVEALGRAGLDAVVVGGDREAVKAVLADRRLAHLEPLVTGPWLSVKDPKLKILAAMPEQFLAVTVTVTDAEPAGGDPSG